MIPMIIETTTTGAAALSKRSQATALRETRFAVAKFWRDRLLFFHFRPAAKVKYRHRRRTRRTEKRKKRLAAIGLVKEGGRVDIVHLGTLKRKIVGIKHAIRAFPTRATVKMEGTKYFKINYRPGKVNIGREVTAFTPHESNQMDKVGTDQLNKSSERLGKSTRRRRRAA